MSASLQAYMIRMVFSLQYQSCIRNKLTSRSMNENDKERVWKIHIVI